MPKDAFSTALLGDPRRGEFIDHGPTCIGAVVLAPDLQYLLVSSLELCFKVLGAGLFLPLLALAGEAGLYALVAVSLASDGLECLLFAHACSSVKRSCWSLKSC